jgi:hypothetical protein
MESPHLSRFETWIRGEQFRWVALIVIAVLALFMAFEAGSAFGFHRASYSYHLEENYGRTFGTTTDRFMQPGTPGGHGAVGKIISVTPTSITISATNGPEQDVSFDADTMIRTQSAAASSSALAPGDSVVIFGEPTDSGGIHARLIRIVPAPTTQP